MNQTSLPCIERKQSGLSRTEGKLGSNNAEYVFLPKLQTRKPREACLRFFHCILVGTSPNKSSFKSSAGPDSIRGKVWQRILQWQRYLHPKIRDACIVNWKPIGFGTCHFYVSKVERQAMDVCLKCQPMNEIEVISTICHNRLQKEIKNPNQVHSHGTPSIL